MSAVSGRSTIGEGGWLVPALPYESDSTERWFRIVEPGLRPVLEHDDGADGRRFWIRLEPGEWTPGEQPPPPEAAPPGTSGEEGGS